MPKTNKQTKKNQTVRFLESLPLKDNLQSKHCMPTITMKFESIMIFVMKPDSCKENTQNL